MSDIKRIKSFEPTSSDSTASEAINLINMTAGSSTDGKDDENRSYMYVLNSHVVVMYDGKYYPGIVEDRENGEYRVSVLHPCRGRNKISNQKI